MIFFKNSRLIFADDTSDYLFGFPIMDNFRDVLDKCKLVRGGGCYRDDMVRDQECSKHENNKSFKQENYYYS
jgi:hypothetical protein